MKLAVNITADCDRAFLYGVSAWQERSRSKSIPLVERWTHPVKPPGPVDHDIRYELQLQNPLDTLPVPLRSAKTTYLVAEPLDVDLCQLLALHQTLDPPIEGRYRRGLFNWRQLGGFWRSANILHVGIHGLWYSLSWWGVVLRVGGGA